MPKNYMLAKDIFMLFVVVIFVVLPFKESNNILITWEATLPQYKLINLSWGSKS
jgi:hypothetical protein